MHHHPGPKTYVIRRRGKNAGRVGYVRGSLQDRLDRKQISKALVYYPLLKFPNDLIFSSVKELDEATPLEIIMEGYEDENL